MLWCKARFPYFIWIIFEKNIKSLAVMAACGAVLIGSGVDVFAKSKVIKESAEVVAENKDQSVNVNEVKKLSLGLKV